MAVHIDAAQFVIRRRGTDTYQLVAQGDSDVFPFELRRTGIQFMAVVRFDADMMGQGIDLRFELISPDHDSIANGKIENVKAERRIYDGCGLTYAHFSLAGVSLEVPGTYVGKLYLNEQLRHEIPIVFVRPGQI